MTNFRKSLGIGALRKVKLSLPLYPFLFAIYPILFIYSINLNESYLSETFSPILISLGVTIFILFTLKFTLKDTQKAALITSASLIFFFSYGHIFNLLPEVRMQGHLLTRHKFLAPAYLILFLILSFLIWKTKANLKSLSKILNIIVVLLILSSLYTIGTFALKNGLNVSEKNSKNKTLSVRGQRGKNSPDIYYIILEDYAGAAFLKSLYHYDNNKFLGDMSKKGFYVVDNSKSNYSITLLNLSSSLNMTYLDDLSKKQVSQREKFKISYKMIRNSAVSKFLKSRGYTYIAIGTFWGGTADNPYADELYVLGQRSEFMRLLYQTSALTLFERFKFGAADSILYAFDKLKEIPKDSRPTFTFAHIVSPHHPYLFDRYGNKLVAYSKGLADDEGRFNQRKEYVEQVIFVNNKVEDMVNSILARSKTPPIIIIQSDEGTASQRQWLTPLDKLTDQQIYERISNLNLYYLPKGGGKILYPTITPVNTFRKMFNYYFGTKFKMLEDKSYFSNYKDYYKFIPVPKESD